MDALYDISGWVGTVLIVLAFFLNSRKIVDSQSNRYHLMNLLGSAGVFVNVWHQKALPAVALQVVWGIIALLALAQNARIAHRKAK